MIRQTKYFLLFISLILLVSVVAQKPNGKLKSVPKKALTKSVVPDSLATLTNDSAHKDSIRLKPSKSALDDVVKYQAKDSIVFMGNNFAKLYGDGKVDYNDINLKLEVFF